MDEQQKPKISRETYSAGECVFREGQFATCAYIIESGRVEILKEAIGGPLLVNTLRAGELFGEMALIIDTNRTATVKATEETALLVVNPGVLNAKLEAADPVVRRLVKVLINRLREQMKARADDIAAVHTS